MTSHNGFAMATAARLPNVLSADGHSMGVQRMHEAASALSRRNVYRARAKLMHEALQTFVSLAYETFDGSNIRANMDVDGAVLVAAPWGSAHYQSYGLRRFEADCLRWEMLRRSRAGGDDPALFVYFDDMRRWYVDLHAYPHLVDAQEYVNRCPVTWRTVHEFARQRT